MQETSRQLLQQLVNPSQPLQQPVQQEQQQLHQAHVTRAYTTACAHQPNDHFDAADATSAEVAWQQQQPHQQPQPSLQPPSLLPAAAGYANLAQLAAAAAAAAAAVSQATLATSRALPDGPGPPSGLQVSQQQQQQRLAHSGRSGIPAVKRPAPLLAASPIGTSATSAELAAVPPGLPLPPTARPFGPPLHAAAAAGVGASALALQAAAGAKRVKLQVAGSSGRILWTADLHNTFLAAVEKLGGADAATPNEILQLMNVEGLSRENVKSHLQKHRQNVREQRLMQHMQQLQEQQIVGSGVQQQQQGYSSQPPVQTGLQVPSCGGLGQDQLQFDLPNSRNKRNRKHQQPLGAALGTLAQSSAITVSHSLPLWQSSPWHQRQQQHDVNNGILGSNPQSGSRLGFTAVQPGDPAGPAAAANTTVHGDGGPITAAGSRPCGVPAALAAEAEAAAAAGVGAQRSVQQVRLTIGHASSDEGSLQNIGNDSTAAHDAHTGYQAAVDPMMAAASNSGWASEEGAAYRAAGSKEQLQQQQAWQDWQHQQHHHQYGQHFGDGSQRHQQSRRRPRRHSWAGHSQAPARAQVSLKQTPQHRQRHASNIIAGGAAGNVSKTPQHQAAEGISAADATVMQPAGTISDQSAKSSPLHTHSADRAMETTAPKLQLLLDIAADYAVAASSGAVAANATNNCYNTANAGDDGLNAGHLVTPSQPVQQARLTTWSVAQRQGHGIASAAAIEAVSGSKPPLAAQHNPCTDLPQEFTAPMADFGLQDKGAVAAVPNSTAAILSAALQVLGCASRARFAAVLQLLSLQGVISWHDPPLQLPCGPPAELGALLQAAIIQQQQLHQEQQQQQLQGHEQLHRHERQQQQDTLQ